MIQKIAKEISRMRHREQRSFTVTKDWTKEGNSEKEGHPFRMTLLHSFKKLRNGLKQGMGEKIEQAKKS